MIVCVHAIRRHNSLHIGIVISVTVRLVYVSYRATSPLRVRRLIDGLLVLLGESALPQV